jgi:hypothetical protein
MSDYLFDVRIEGFNRLYFDKRLWKKAIRSGGTLVKDEARRLISRRAISAPGELPGIDSGAMRRSIRVKIGSGGGYAKIRPVKTSEMGPEFYPAFLIHGTSRGLRPRKDFMIEALNNKRDTIKAAMIASLQNSLRAE